MCGNPTLVALDRQAQTAQAAVTAGADRKKAVKASKTVDRFVRRRDKCGDDACLVRLYTERIAELTRLLPATTAAPLPICMPAEYRRHPVHCRPSRLRVVRPSFISQ